MADRKRRIFISGRISFLKYEDVLEKFQNAETKLLGWGYDVVNPTKLKHNHNKEWLSYVLECIEALRGCDEIYMLKDWEYSEGAIIEHLISVKLKIKIQYE